MPISHKASSNNNGYTLLEMSVVLVIVGIIVAGILSGKELMEQSKIRSSIVSVKKIQNAYSLFNEKYNGYPGDLSTASAVISGASNGNGDEKYTATPFSTNSENFNAWYQLEAVNLIQGSFTGTGTGAVINTNSPSTPFNNNTTAAFYYGNFGNTTYPSYNSLILEGITSNATIFVSQAEAIDKKMDDGNPFTGGILSYGTSSGECSSVFITTSPNAAARTTVTYNTSSPSQFCIMAFGLEGRDWQ